MISDNAKIGTGLLAGVSLVQLELRRRDVCWSLLLWRQWIGRGNGLLLSLSLDYGVPICNGFSLTLLLLCDYTHNIQTTTMITGNRLALFGMHLLFWFRPLGAWGCFVLDWAYSDHWTIQNFSILFQKRPNSRYVVRISFIRKKEWTKEGIFWLRIVLLPWTYMLLSLFVVRPNTFHFDQVSYASLVESF